MCSDLTDFAAQERAEKPEWAKRAIKQVLDFMGHDVVLYDYSSIFEERPEETGLKAVPPVVTHRFTFDLIYQTIIVVATESRRRFDCITPNDTFKVSVDVTSRTSLRNSSIGPHSSYLQFIENNVHTTYLMHRNDNFGH